MGNQRSVLAILLSFSFLLLVIYLLLYILFINFQVDWQDAPDRSWPALHFNLSHTSSMIACGITTYSPVRYSYFAIMTTTNVWLILTFFYSILYAMQIGIDVENKNRTLKNEIIPFARRFFSLNEVEYLARILDPEMQRQDFIKMWTLRVLSFYYKAAHAPCI